MFLPTANILRLLTELKGKGFVAGYAEGTFKLEKEASRAAKHLLRVINAIIKENSLQPIFLDVLKQSWYSKFIATAYAEGF